MPPSLLRRLRVSFKVPPLVDGTLSLHPGSGAQPLLVDGTLPLEPRARSLPSVVVGKSSPDPGTDITQSEIYPVYKRTAKLRQLTSDVFLELLDEVSL
ncbi:Dispersed gene family protein 1 (DGF-1) [Trichuris trichiura]|uniref:Dispersed gene family protein 1 (DGF-1) n=1 Tax=Trichuris trichiura TaxID=36087 RepID=A0A077ZR91_TRITR|nr:Dispersed gene family protein 1 (DGF-1) [Trichuris trichiura]